MDAASGLRAGKWQSHSICTQWRGGKDSADKQQWPVSDLRC